MICVSLFSKMSTCDRSTVIKIEWLRNRGLYATKFIRGKPTPMGRAQYIYHLTQNQKIIV